MKFCFRILAATLLAIFVIETPLVWIAITASFALVLFFLFHLTIADGLYRTIGRG